MTGPSPLQTPPPGQPTPRTHHSPAASALRSWLTIPAPRASDCTAQILSRGQDSPRRPLPGCSPAGPPALGELSPHPVHTSLSHSDGVVIYLVLERVSVPCGT